MSVRYHLNIKNLNQKNDHNYKKKIDCGLTLKPQDIDDKFLHVDSVPVYFYGNNINSKSIKKFSFKGQSQDEVISIIKNTERDLDLALEKKKVLESKEIKICVKNLFENTKYLWKLKPSEYENIEPVYSQVFNLFDSEGKHPKLRLKLLRTCLIPMNYELGNISKAKYLEKKAIVIEEAHLNKDVYDFHPFSCDPSLNPPLMQSSGDFDYSINGKELLVDLPSILKNFANPLRQSTEFGEVLVHYPILPEEKITPESYKQEHNETILEAFVDFSEMGIDYNRYKNLSIIHQNDDVFCEKIKDMNTNKKVVFFEKTRIEDIKLKELVFELKKNSKKNDYNEKYEKLFEMYQLNQDFRDLVLNKKLVDVKHTLNQINNRQSILYGNTKVFITKFPQYKENASSENESRLEKTFNGFTGSLIEEMLHSKEASKTYGLLKEYYFDDGLKGSKKHFKREAWNQPGGLKDMIIEHWVNNHLIDAMKPELRKIKLIEEAVNDPKTPIIIKDVLQMPGVNPNYKLTAIRYKNNSCFQKLIRENIVKNKSEKNVNRILKYAFWGEGKSIRKNSECDISLKVKSVDPDLIKEVKDVGLNNSDFNKYIKYNYFLRTCSLEASEQKMKENLMNNSSEFISSIPDEINSDQRNEYGKKIEKIGKVLIKAYLVKQIFGGLWPDNGFAHLLGLDQSNSIASSLLTPELLSTIGNPVDHINTVAHTGTSKAIIKSIMKIEDKNAKGETLKVSDVFKIIKDECKLSAMLAGGFTLMDESLDRFHFTLPDDAQFLSLIDNDKSGSKLAKILDHMNSHTMTKSDKENLVHIVDNYVRSGLLVTKVVKSKTHNFSEKTKVKNQKEIIKENYLTPLFVTQIERDRKNKSADIPNSLMLVGPDSKAINELIDWTGRNSDCNFVKIKHTDDLLECLEDAEDNYQETKMRTLIHVDSLDKLLNPQVSPDHTIGALKDIMCATSEDYHSTIIFSTKNPSKLDSIAIGDNRVDHRIDVDLD